MIWPKDNCVKSSVDSRSWRIERALRPVFQDLRQRQLLRESTAWRGMMAADEDNTLGTAGLNRTEAPTNGGDDQVLTSQTTWYGRTETKKRTSQMTGQIRLLQKMVHDKELTPACGIVLAGAHKNLVKGSLHQMIDGCSLLRILLMVFSQPHP